MNENANELVDTESRLVRTTFEQDVIRQAREASARILSNKDYIDRQRWPDWKAIGQAFEIGQNAAMRTAGTNKPYGPRYRKAIRNWLDTAGLAEVLNDKTKHDKEVRSRLRFLTKNND